MRSAIERSDADAVLPVAVGTITWAIALVILIAVRDRLDDAGNGWWIAVAATAVALGAIGLIFLIPRRARRNRSGVT